MDGIAPPSASPSAQSQLQQQYGFEAQFSTAQVQQSVPIGTAILAQVMGNDKNGNIIVRANGSDLVLSSPIALAKGAQVQIRLDTVSGNIVAQLLSIDGKLPVYRPQDAQNQPQKNPMDSGVPLKLVNILPEGAARVTPPQAQAQAAAQRVDSVVLSSPNTNTLKGVVIQPSPEIMQGVRATLSLSQSSEEKLIKTLPSELNAGAQVNVKITGIESQQPKPQAPQTNIPQAAPPQQNEEVDTSNTVLKGQEWMQKNAELGVKNNLNWLENFIPTMKATPQGTLQMNGLVMDAQADGELTVETKLGLMLISGSANSKTANLERGAQIMLEVTGFIKQAAPAKTSELPQFDKDSSLLKNLFGNDKGAAEKLAGVQNNFGSKLSSFINAVKSGDAEAWLGRKFLDSLDDTTRAALVTKLNGDFANLKNLMNDGPQLNWQTILFPVFDGKELNQARLHVKKFKDESTASVDSIGTRFIVDLETSYYGEMQFDGLVRRLAPQKSFDLIIRTHKPLDEETRNEITSIFHITQDVSRFKGGIEFSTNNQFPLEPWKEVVNKKAIHNSFTS